MPVHVRPHTLLRPISVAVTPAVLLERLGVTCVPEMHADLVGEEFGAISVVWCRRVLIICITVEASVPASLHADTVRVIGFEI